MYYGTKTSQDSLILTRDEVY